MMEFYAQAVVRGLLLGIMASFLGWAKNSNPGKFDIRGLIAKLPVGILVGVASSIYEVPFDDTLQWATGLGIDEVLDKVTKAVVRRIRPSWLEMPTDRLEFDPETAEALFRISDAEKLGREEVIRCTEAFRAVTAKLLDMSSVSDREFKQHLDFAFNQILQNARKTGWIPEVYEESGKLLFRLFRVWRAYRADQNGLSPQQWAKEIKIIVQLLQAVFSGTK